jgi:hypothetical protein
MSSNYGGAAEYIDPGDDDTQYDEDLQKALALSLGQEYGGKFLPHSLGGQLFNLHCFELGIVSSSSMSPECRVAPFKFCGS